MAGTSHRGGDVVWVALDSEGDGGEKSNETSGVTFKRKNSSASVRGSARCGIWSAPVCAGWCGAASGWQRGGCMDAVEGRWRRTAEQTLCRGLRCNTCVYGELT